MSLDADAQQSGHSKNSRNKRATSMDLEFHGGEEEAEGSNPADASSHASSCPSDDDSEFGEAADDQLPDQAFLEAILIEYHPDRLNLLEPENGEPAPEETPAPPATAEPSEEERAAEDALDTMEVDPQKLATVDSEDPKDDVTGYTEEQEEKNDDFTSSPKRLARPLQKNLLQNMGTSTRKSFRKMGGSEFWAKSFKNLGRSITRRSKVDDS
jgi:hypothetical protein